jgi:hypothetical protein
MYAGIEAAMAPFPESATSAWIVGLVLVAAVASATALALIIRYWPRRGR